MSGELRIPNVIVQENGAYVMWRRVCLIFVLLSFQSPAIALQDYAVTREENASLPTFCRTPSLMRSLNDAGCKMINHYCYGLAHMMRVDKHTPESGYWLTVALTDFRSAANHAVASCPLLPEMRFNLGNVLLRQAAISGGTSGEAATNFMKALTLKPDYLPAYFALSDYYVKLGDKKNALSVVEDGLRHLPNSKGLLRRFKALGGTTPPAPIAITSKPEADAAMKHAPQGEQDAQKDNAISETHTGRVPSAQKIPDDQSTESKIGTPSNPWCRFCPPE